MSTQYTEKNELSFVRLKSESVPLTPELAQSFHDMQASPTERDLSLPRVRHLKEKIRHGLAVTFHWATADLNGKTLRMNGNHSSAALLELNGEFPEHLVAHVDRYQVADAWGLALLFRQFDDRKSARSGKDICGAYQGLFPQLHEVPKKSAKLAVEGIGWYRQNIQNPEGMPIVRGDDIGTLFNETLLHPFIKFIGELFTIKTPELERVHIVAAIYATFNIDKEDARTFWTEVARGGPDYESTAPATILDNELEELAKEKKTGEMKPANWYSGCIYAWNAYRKGKQIESIVWDVKKAIQNPV